MVVRGGMGFLFGFAGGDGVCVWVCRQVGFPDLISLPLLGRGCRQNGLWWVWVCRRGYGGCGFGFAGVGVGVMGGCFRL
uniref:Uncharacterized protein n=1 Tax=Fagus sylvatica TaxID=28930 RepID=A0A2N9EGT8_FAGSY